MTEIVLVTGGAGFIGSHLVDALITEGHHVRVFDNLDAQVHGGLREENRWPDYINLDAEYNLGDVCDRDALRKAMRGVDVIFHLAALVGVGQSMYEIERYVDVNVRGTAILLDILVNDTSIRNRVRKIIVASSMSVYGEGIYECPIHGLVAPEIRLKEQLEAHDWELRCPEHIVTSPNGICGQRLQPLPTNESKTLAPTSIYAITKKDQEEMFIAIGRAYGIPAVALRYFNTYGPRQALSNPYTGVAAIFCSRLINGNPPMIFEDGKQRRDLVHISDVVQASVLAMEKDEADYGVFNVGAGRVITIQEVAEVLSSHLDGEIHPEVIGKFRAGDIRHCFPDISRIRTLGFRPRHRFEDGVDDLVAWVRSQTAVDGFDEAAKVLADRDLIS